MSKKNRVFLLSTLLLLNSCATLNDSIILGASIGAVGGIAASSSTYDKNGNSFTKEEQLSNIGLGLAIGAIAAYFIHDNTTEYRKDYYYNNPEIYFGDLPPSPFIMTPNEKKRGK